MMRICLVSMCSSGFVIGLVAIGFPESYFVVRRCGTAALGIQSVQRPREGNGLSNVLQAADPGHCALNAHAESRVRHTAVLAQVEIPLERLFRQAMLVNALKQKLIRRC